MELFPRVLVRVVTDTPDADMGRFAHAPLLLVRLDDGDGRLAAGLKKTTDASDLTMLEPSVTRTLFQPSAEANAVKRLPALLREAPYYVLLLTKRYTPGEPRIRVGRDQGCDVVLDHPTVSSTHAWLDAGEDVIQVLWDSGSKNGTRVNGQRVVGAQPVKTYPGDRILFGDVQTTHCTFKTLREALLSRGA